MGYTNPIGLALRDAGQAFGGLLEQEARRRDQGLQREVSLAELALRGTQAQQQGQLAQAQVGVSLAQAQAQGRQQQEELALRGRQLDIQQTHSKLLAPHYAALAQTEEEQAAKLKREREAEEMRIPVSHLDTALTGFATQAGGPEFATAIRPTMHAWTQGVVDINNLPTDAQGNRSFTIAQGKALVGYLKDMYAITKKDTLTPQERQTAIDRHLKMMDADITRQALSPALKNAHASAAVDYPTSYTALSGRMTQDEQTIYKEKEKELLAQKNKGIYPSVFGGYAAKDLSKDEQKTLREIAHTAMEPVWYQELTTLLQSGRAREKLPSPGPGQPAPAATTPPTAPVPVADRLNNPLNIKLGSATQYLVEQGMATTGEAAADGGHFLQFRSPTDGLMAAKRLFQGPTYSGLSVDAALRKWSNNGYNASILRETGIAPGTQVSALSDAQVGTVLHQMATRERGGPPLVSIAGSQAPSVASSPSYSYAGAPTGPLGVIERVPGVVGAIPGAVQTGAATVLQGTRGAFGLHPPSSEAGPAPQVDLTLSPQPSLAQAATQGGQQAQLREQLTTALATQYPNEARYEDGWRAVQYGGRTYVVYLQDGAIVQIRER